MMVIYLPVKFEFDWSNRFKVRSPETKNVDGQTDGQTDVGHINLIGGLRVTNKNSKIQNGCHFLGRGNFFENWQEYIAQIACGSKISTKSLYLAR